MQGSEKVYADYTFESLNPGGHSSEPVRDNAIYHLSAALTRLRDFDFPVKVNEITQNYFAQTAKMSPRRFRRADLKAVAKDPPPSRRRPPLARALLQHSAAHHLRRHHALGGTPPTPSPKWPAPTSTAAFSPAKIPKKSAKLWSASPPIPRSPSP